MTFAVLPAHDPAPTVTMPAGLPSQWAFTGGGFEEPVHEVVGIEVVDAAAGRVSLEVRPYLHNSFGALQGGVIGMLAEAAGAESLGAALGGDGSDVVVTDLQIAYLALGRVGPVTTSARVLEAGGDGRCSAVVEFRDSGGGDRLMTVANVVAVPTVAFAGVTLVNATGRDGDEPVGETDRRRHVSDYFRLERWEVPAAGEQPPAVRGRLRSTTTPGDRGAGCAPAGCSPTSTRWVGSRVAWRCSPGGS